MGYGFVEFEDAGATKEAIKRMQSSTLDGHALQLKISSNAGSAAGAAPQRKRSRDDADAPGAGADKATAKLMVKNIAFQASKGDLRELFTAYGDLKSVRLPKRFDGRPRGFAFVEYSSAKEAAAAVAALSATHLYGRHLVLEYAASDDVVQSQSALQAAAADDANVAAGGDRKVKAKQRRMDE
jgi:multiple RNA-binding domain-containing protein 1